MKNYTLEIIAEGWNKKGKNNLKKTFIVVEKFSRKRDALSALRKFKANEWNSVHNPGDVHLLNAEIRRHEIASGKCFYSQLVDYRRFKFARKYNPNTDTYTYGGYVEVL